MCEDFDIKVDLVDGALEIKVDIPEISFASGSGSVSIINDETNAIIATVMAPGSYRVLVFSGIDGGSANTTYTNSMIPA